MNPIETGPLSSEDLLVLEHVFARRKLLARAVSLARGNAAVALVSAIMCVLCAFADAQLVLAALVLGASGLFELRAARMLRELDPRAPKWLARNQLLLLAAVALYCLHGIVAGLAAPSPNLGLDPGSDLANQLGDVSALLGSESGGLFDRAYRGAIVGVYVTLLCACALYQGGCAWFYASRAPVVRAHARESPPWALALERKLLGW